MDWFNLLAWIFWGMAGYFIGYKTGKVIERDKWFLHDLEGGQDADK